MNKRKRLISFAAALSCLLCGCAIKTNEGEFDGKTPLSLQPDITSSVSADETTAATAATTTATAAVTTTASTTAATTATAATTPAATTAATSVTTPAASKAPTAQLPQGYELTDSDKAFLKKSCFVGDSICNSIYLCDFVGLENMVAQPCTAARNIYEYDFKYTDKNSYGLIESIAMRKPEYVIFWMGMNDVNMVEREDHAKNYEKLLSDVKKVLPDAKLYVLSTSPITVGSRFSRNERIDDFNLAVKEMIAKHSADGWQYVDISKYLKDSTNSLKPEYDSGDGIHLNIPGVTATVDAVCLEIKH